MRSPGRRRKLAAIAEALAATPLQGNQKKAGKDLEPILSHFPRKDPSIGFDWCAAFAYHCCVLAGFGMPIRYPELPCNFAGIIAWLCWAKLPGNRFYYSRRHGQFRPMRGDLVIYDNLLGDGPHDHIGVVLKAVDSQIITAEGNVTNRSGIFQRKRDHHIRGFIRIGDVAGVPDSVAVH